MSLEEENRSVDIKTAAFLTAEWRYLLMLNYNIDSSIVSTGANRATLLIEGDEEI